jgi:sporulation protein YlmC with PRC-barrel domain
MPRPGAGETIGTARDQEVVRMKLKATVMLAALLAAGWGTLAYAESGTQGAGTYNSGNASGTGTTQHSTTGSMGAQGVLIGASSIIGADVKDSSGQKLGDIKQLMVAQDGKIQSAIISTGGVLGMGSKQVAVPWNDLKIARDNSKNIVVTADRDLLAKAPSYDEGQAEATGNYPATNR